MKRTYFSIAILALSFCGLFASCEKERVTVEETPLTVQDNLYPTKFSVSVDGISDDSKAIFNSSDYLSLVFQNNDKIYINGYEFTLQKSGSKWRVMGTGGSNPTNDTVIGIGSNSDEYYFYFGQSPATSAPNGGLTGTYTSVSFVSTLVDDPDNTGTAKYKQCTSGIVLGGKIVDDSVVSLYPSFAVIIVQNTYESAFPLEEVAIGFEDNKIVKRGSVTPQVGTYPTVSAHSYLEGVKRTTTTHPMLPITQTSDVGDFIKATTSDISGDVDETINRWHIIVPMDRASVTTNLYIKYVYSGTILYKKIENVTLQRGKVHTYQIM